MPRDSEGGPVYLAAVLEQLITQTHDAYMMAAAARLYPRTIQNIVMRKPVSQVTLDKVSFALSRGELAPKPSPAQDASHLPERVHRYALWMGGPVAAAAFLKVTPLVVAKLIYGRPVNRRFRLIVMRRLEIPPERSPGQSVPTTVLLDPSSQDGLAQCREAYELYRQHGTLQAVGRCLDLSRERVRQLINRGIAYGVIPAKPHYTEASHPFPFSSRDEFLTAYRRTPNLRRLLQGFHISRSRLKRFFHDQQVFPQDLTRIRHEVRRQDHKGEMVDFVVNL